MNLLRLFCALALFSINVITFAAGASDDKQIAAVISAEKARGAALRAADTKALGAILADDFKYTHSNGYLETKQIHIDSFVKGLRYASFETTNVVGHAITPDVVVLNGIIDQRKGVAEKWTDYHLLFHSVWRKKGDAWQIVSLQTALPPPPAKK
jgi:hypothetical protein